MTITISLNDDNGTNAPLYAKYEGQSQPQPAYLEFDPANQETLELKAQYNGGIGNAVPFDVWNGQILRFWVNPQVHRDSLNNLADNEKLASLLETVREGFSSFWEDAAEHGRLTGEAQEACQNIQSLLRDEVSLCEVWSAEWWVETDFDPDKLAAAGIASYAEDAASAIEEHQAVIGNLQDAVVDHAQACLQRYIDQESLPSATAERIAALLAEYNADEYGHLPSEYREAFPEGMPDLSSESSSTAARPGPN